MVKGVCNYSENQCTTSLCGSITHYKKIMEIKDVYMRIKQKLGVDRDDQIAEKLGITKQSVCSYFYQVFTSFLIFESTWYTY